MTGLNEAGARTAGPPPGMGRAGVLLQEIAQLLDSLARNGGDARIDLKSLALDAADYAALRRCLGEGAVAARVNAGDATEVRETRFPGVWWVTHFGESNEVVAEFLEICKVPEILASPPEDIARGLSELRESLAAH